MKKKTSVVALLMFLGSITISTILGSQKSVPTESVFLMQDTSETTADEIILLTENDLESFSSPYTKEDIQLLAQYMTLVGDEKDMYRAAAICLNRLRSEYSPFKSLRSVKEILYQQNQLPVSVLDKLDKGISPSEEALKLASEMLSGEKKILPEDILWYSYRNSGLKSWGMQKFILEGDEEFIYFQPKSFE